MVEDDGDVPRRAALRRHRGPGPAAGERRGLRQGGRAGRRRAVTLRTPQFQVAVSVSVVFLPGSVPADLPRQLPYGDVREERVPVSCKSPAVGLCPVPPPLPIPVAPGRR